MVLDVVIDSDSLTIEITNPYHPDLNAIAGDIRKFARSRHADIDGLLIQGLIPRMIRGIAGCEGGCPADAKSLVSAGAEGFRLDYIEGGILSARSALPDGRVFTLRMFPDF